MGLGYVTARCDYAVELGDCLFLAALVAFGLRWATEERRFASRATLRQRTPLKAEQPSAQELLVMEATAAAAASRPTIAMENR